MGRRRMGTIRRGHGLARPRALRSRTREQPAATVPASAFAEAPDAWAAYNGWSVRRVGRLVVPRRSGSDRRGGRHQGLRGLAGAAAARRADEGGVSPVGAELVNELAAGGELESFVSAGGGDDRRALIADWRRRLVDRRLAPSTINVALASATSLLDSRGCGRRPCAGAIAAPQRASHSDRSARPAAEGPQRLTLQIVLDVVRESGLCRSSGSAAQPRCAAPPNANDAHVDARLGGWKA